MYEESNTRGTKMKSIKSDEIINIEGMKHKVVKKENPIKGTSYYVLETEK